MTGAQKAVSLSAIKALKRYTMKNDYTSFLKEIQQTILSFSEGDIPFDEALQRYNAYTEKLKNDKTEKQYEDYIINCLGTHNAYNFSIFSALVAYLPGEPCCKICSFYGPDTFITTINSMCNKDFFSSPPRFLLDYSVHDKVSQNFSFHSSLIVNSESFSIIFIAITSSSFFSKDSFLQFSAQLKTFMSPFTVTDSMSLDIPNCTLHYIHQTCIKLLPAPLTLYGIHLLSPFSTLSHFGLYSLLEVSSIIKSRLIDIFGQYAFALSMNRYLCISTNPDINTRLFTIVYKEISIPAKFYKKTIEKEEEITPTLIEILHFR